MLNSTRRKLLEIFNLDIEIIDAFGCEFTDSNGKVYTDFLSQYGSLPFGHNPPEIWEAIKNYKKTGKPVMMQPLRPLEAEKLADRLCDLTGMDEVIFANSGAEAVEAAIKLARVRTGKDVILSTVKGFHGKTMGALSATGNTRYQKDFGLPVENFKYIEYGRIKLLEKNLEGVAAFIVEPIQGEGGIIVPDDNYIDSVIDICREHGVICIVDEIQTGLGRTGTMFASKKQPDILLLAKALGGGVMPISAMLAKSEVWDERFGQLHSSTFANNNLACAAGNKTLDMLPIELEDLKSELDRLMEKYPSIIRNVRGKGYMCGVEFYPIIGTSGFMTYSSLNQALALIYAGYLLHEHGILTAPAFSSPFTLRIQPPLIAGKKEINKLIIALNDLCQILVKEEYYKLVKHLKKPENDELFVAQQGPSRHNQEKVPGRFCFSIHYTEKSDIYKSDPTFTNLDIDQYIDWVKYVGPGFAWPIGNIKSPTGAIANGFLMSIPLLSEEIMTDRKDAQAMIEAAIDMSEEAGATRFGLGAFTSIVTNGGEWIKNNNVPLTSGSTLTTVAGVEALQEMVPDNSIVAVIGASGSIGALAVKMIERWAKKVIPVGRNDNLEAALDEANAIFVATNSRSALIDPSKLNSGTVVCDVARPKNVVGKPADGVIVFDGGLVELPSEVDLGPFHTLPKNLCWGCLGETILLALEGETKNYSVGRDLSLEDADYISTLAKKHGFKIRKILNKDK